MPKAPTTVAPVEPTPKIVQKSESGEIRDSFQKVWSGYKRPLQNLDFNIDPIFKEDRVIQGMEF